MKNYNDVYDDKQKMCTMMDTAYSKGYDKAYNDRKIEEEFDEDRAKAIEEAYQKGLDDAWKSAQKLRGMTFFDRKNIFSTESVTEIFNRYSASEAIAKIKEYEEKKKAEDEIKVGDEVMNIENGNTHIITKIAKANYANYIDADGTVGFIDPVLYKKTGRHFDIQSLFDQMNDEQ